jgi:outer membrane protein TolC
VAYYYDLLDLNRADEISLDQTLEIGRTKFEVGSQTQADVLIAETERQKIIEARRDLQQNVIAKVNAGEGLTIPFDSVLPTGSGDGQLW